MEGHPLRWRARSLRRSFRFVVARARRGAAKAFRMSEALRPWSMAEIFAIGCAVALIKITDLADVEFGPAFWMFSALALLVVLQDQVLCRWSVWTSLTKT